MEFVSYWTRICFFAHQNLFPRAPGPWGPPAWGSVRSSVCPFRQGSLSIFSRRLSEAVGSILASYSLYERGHHRKFPPCCITCSSPQRLDCFAMPLQNTPIGTRRPEEPGWNRGAQRSQGEHTQPQGEQKSHTTLKTLNPTASQEESKITSKPYKPRP